MQELTHKLARISGLSYLPRDHSIGEFAQLGFSNLEFINNDGAQAYVLWNKTEMVIVFRGTEANKWNDIKADLRAWLVPSAHGKIHKGFDIELEKLWYRIEHKIESLAIGKKLYITGHSLGGAMATLCASRLTEHPEIEVDFLCTFGSPRVGNRKCVGAIATKHHRYVNNNDVVTSVPPALLTYKHHGEMKYINHYGDIRNLTLWQRIKDQWRGRFAAMKKRVPFDGAYDHSIKYYIRYTGDKNA
jgi:triacylglycerol lipase